MNNLTQIQLLSEGFWDNFTKPARLASGLARGAIAGTAKALDYTLPELTKPIHGIEKASRDIIKTGVQRFDQVYKGREGYVKQKLADLGYNVHNDATMKRSGENYVIPAYKILDYTPDGKPIEDKKSTPFLVDKDGNILRNLRHAKNHP